MPFDDIQVNFLLSRFTFNFPLNETHLLVHKQ